MTMSAKLRLASAWASVRFYDGSALASKELSSRLHRCSTISLKTFFWGNRLLINCHLLAQEARAYARSDLQQRVNLQGWGTSILPVSRLSACPWKSGWSLTSRSWCRLGTGLRDARTTIKSYPGSYFPVWQRPAARKGSILVRFFL